MKKNLACIVLIFTIILNVYLMFYWNPGSEYVNEKNNSEQTVTCSESLYKVDKDKAIKELTDEERKNLETIMGKLSAFDLGKIKEYIADPNDEEGIKSIFMLLRKRLTSEDYETIKNISSKFLDIERVNQLLKNNYV